MCSSTMAENFFVSGSEKVELDGPLGEGADASDSDEDESDSSSSKFSMNLLSRGESVHHYQMNC